MFTPSSSTSQLVSSSSSTTSSVPQKDFSSSFGMLQSTYGLSGSVPTPVSQSQLPVKSSRPSKSTRFFGSRPSGQNVQSAGTPSSSQKDFESSFGQLQSQYGFAGPLSATIKSGPKKPGPMAGALLIVSTLLSDPTCRRLKA